MRILPEIFSARAATIDDAEIAVALVNACSVELIGRPQFEVHELRADWTSPNVDPETDLQLVFAADNQLVGYAGVWDAEPHVQMFGWGNVHPDHKSQGIGTYLAGWVEERARRSISKAPEGARVVLQQSRLGIDTAAQELLERERYRATRYEFRMIIEMDTPPPEPKLPEGVNIQTFDREKHLRDVIRAEREMFKDHWGYVESPFEEEHREWAHWIDNSPDHDPSLWFLALDGDAIAGLALCRPKMAEDPQAGYVDLLGVRRPWRRRGVALALLHHSFGELFRRGVRRVALDVDAQNLTGATRVYEKAGMRVQREAVIYEKELRPGKDLRTVGLDA